MHLDFMMKERFQMDNVDKNVIQFETFTSLYNKDAEEKSFQAYLELLSFSELIAESNEVMRELRNGNLNAELTKRSKQILKEFERRIGNTSTCSEKSDNPALKKILQFANQLQ